MQKRSPANTLIYNLLTLGLYELAWLSKTRRELMAETGIHIPSVAWLVALAIFRVVASVVILVAIFVLFSQPNQPCLTADPLAILCHFQANASRAAGITRTQATWALAIVIPLAMASWLAYPLWLTNYIRAVVRATHGRLNETSASLLLMASPRYGLPVVQQALNDPDSMPPAFATAKLQRVTLPQSIEGNKTLKRVVATIAIVMVVLFTLLIAALVAFSYYGTH